jgi:hypothetical protein
MSAVEKFPILLSEAEEESSAVPPCFSDEGINVCCSSPRIAPPGALPFPNTNPPTSRNHHYDTNHTTLHLQYLYIRHNNLYLLALTKRNTNAAEILLFLHKIVEVFTEYFKELEEESIRDNFVVIYELLDEMMDFGYPQTTETKILQEYVRRGAPPFPPLPLCNSRPIAQTNNLPPQQQIHNPRIPQTRNPSSPPHSRNQRRLLAQRRNPLPQKRSLPRRNRVAQPPSILQRQRPPL